MPTQNHGNADAHNSDQRLSARLLRAALSPRTRKLLSYYKPYRALLAADVACASVVSLSTLLLPLAASYITRHVVPGDVGMAGQIYTIGVAMLALVAVQTASSAFV